MSDVDTAELLHALGALRKAAGPIETKLRRGSVHRGALETLRKNVDEVAGLITGP